MDSFPEPLARLVRDHREALRFVDDAREASEHAEAHTDAGAFSEFIEAVRDLEAFLGETYGVHASKEQVVLVATLRVYGADVDTAAGRMAAEQMTLRGLRTELEEALRRNDGRPSAEVVATMRAEVERAGAALLEHVQTTERGIFPIAVAHIPAEALPGIERQMVAIDAGLVRWRT